MCGTVFLNGAIYILYMSTKSNAQFYKRVAPGLSLLWLCWQLQSPSTCPLFSFLKQRIDNSREPHCFCVSHSHFDIWSHVFFRLHKLCIFWSNEHPPLIGLLGELWIAEYGLHHSHQCSDCMRRRCGLAEKRPVWPFGTIFIYTYNRVQRATKCKHTSWAGLCHYTPLLLWVCVYLYIEVYAVVCVCGPTCWQL